MLGEGSLSLATVRLLASHLTAENHQELLAAATGKSKRRVEELLVRYFPRPEVASSVRKLPAAKAVPHSRTRRGRLAPDRYEIRFTASAQTREKLGQAQDLLRHAIPTGDVAEVFVEFHHVDPHGVGGEATAENIQLRCSAHNAFESELFYGHGRPTERRTRPGKSSSPPP